MKRNIIIIMSVAMLSALVLSGCSAAGEQTISADSSNNEYTAKSNESTDEDFGSAGALDKSEFTIKEMLIFAIQDEYMARQEYESIMREFGEQKPFSNILKAEVTHIQWLEELFNKYAIEIPKDNSADYLVLPESIEEALELGVQAEINNIAMYEKFLSEELPEDIEAVFIELRDASENHLAAFEKGPRGNGGSNE